MAVGNLDKPSTHDEVPSADFGWSGEAPKAQTIAAVLTILALLAMLIGNHKGHVEDIFLITFASIIGLIVVWNNVKHKIGK